MTNVSVRDEQETVVDLTQRVAFLESLDPSDPQLPGLRAALSQAQQDLSAAVASGARYAVVAPGDAGVSVTLDSLDAIGALLRSYVVELTPDEQGNVLSLPIVPVHVGGPNLDGPIGGFHFVAGAPGGTFIASADGYEQADASVVGTFSYFNSSGEAIDAIRVFDPSPGVAGRIGAAQKTVRALQERIAALERSLPDSPALPQLRKQLERSLSELNELIDEDAVTMIGSHGNASVSATVESRDVIGNPIASHAIDLVPAAGGIISSSRLVLVREGGTIGTGRSGDLLVIAGLPGGRLITHADDFDEAVASVAGTTEPTPVVARLRR